MLDEFAEGLIGGLIIAWILSWFGVHMILIQGIKDLFGYALTVPAYYVCFGILGLVSSLLYNLRRN